MTPEQQQALQAIARLRSAGFRDPEIFAMPRDQVVQYGAPGSQLFRVGGGAAYLPYQIQQAQILAANRLARAELARQMGVDEEERQERDFARMANPFQLVPALEAYAQRGYHPGQSKYLADMKPALPQGGVRTAGAQYVKDFLDVPETEPADIKRVRDAYAKDPKLAQEFFEKASGKGVKKYAKGGKRETRGMLLMMEPRGEGMFELTDIAGEAGPESIEITPEKAKRAGVRAHATGGTLYSQADRDRTAGVRKKIASARTPEDRGFAASGISDRGEYDRLVAGRNKRVSYGQAFYQNPGESDASWNDRMGRMDAQERRTSWAHTPGVRQGLARLRGVRGVREGLARFHAGGGPGGAENAGAPAPAPGGMPLVGPQQQAQAMPAGDDSYTRANRVLGDVLGTNTFIRPEDVQAMRGGMLPGMGAFSPQAWRAMGGTRGVRGAALMGRLLSTGLFSSPEEIELLIDQARPAAF